MTQEKLVWQMAGLATCMHPEIQETTKGAYRFLNCPCGWHETWESTEDWTPAFVPTGTEGPYVTVSIKCLMSPLAVEALLILGANDAHKTATLAAVMLEDKVRDRVLGKFARDEAPGSDGP